MTLWNYLLRLREGIFGGESSLHPPAETVAELDLKGRSYRFEALEAREMLTADPLYLGGVYIEEDPGSDDNGGDTFEVSFIGGAPGTQLNRVVIDLDHDGLPTVGTNDLIFDTVQQNVPNLTDSLGKGAAFPFSIVSKTGDFTVNAIVSDGSTKLILEFTGFDAGDKLVFSIDVDEVNNINNGPIDGLDEVASGIEMHGSKITGEFSAPHFQNATLTATYTDNYGFSGTNLPLSPNNTGATAQNPAGKANRTAGGFNNLTQDPLPIAISGVVFHDHDLDLTRDPGDEALANVSLSLWRKENGVFVDTGHSTLTNAAGEYRFGSELGLQPGTFQVRETQPAGFFSVGAIPGNIDGVTSGTTVPGDPDMLTEIAIPLGGVESVHNDFAEAKLAKISGWVHLTTPDGDCYADDLTLHQPVVGAKVQLIDKDGNVVQETFTDADGMYYFNNIMPGEYSVKEYTPPGLIDGADHVGKIDGVLVGTTGAENDLLEHIILKSGDEGVHYDFCEHLPASLCGYVYHDRNNNGVKDPGEEGIQGVEVYLLDAAGNRVTLTDSSGNPIGQSVFTDADGEYCFTNLSLNTYTVVEVHPPGWKDGLDAPGTINGVTKGTVNNVNGGDIIRQVHLQWGEHGVNYNFGEFKPSTLQGIVYADPNRNLVFDTGDTLLSNVTIHLVNDQGQIVSTTTTDNNGHYIFTEIDPGTYTVCEIQPPQYFNEAQLPGHLVGDPTINGDGSIENLIREVVVGSESHYVEYDFAEIPAGQISGYVFIDGPDIQLGLNQTFTAANVPGVRDGQFTADDRPIAGVWLELRDGITGTPIDSSVAVPGIYAPGPIRVQTDATGFYIFTGLPGGNYAVFQVHPSGNYIDGLDTPGTQSGIAFNINSIVNPLIVSQLSISPQNDAIIRIALPPGAVSEQNNFSEVRVIPQPPIFDEPPPPPPPPTPPLNFIPPPTPYVPQLAPPPPPPPTMFSGAMGYTWHLSVVDAGKPRQVEQNADHETFVWLTSTHFHEVAWDADKLRFGSWELATSEEGQLVAARKYIFGLEGATPVAGDFNGDGVHEIGVFYRGEWFIDLNGNGVWDEGDLWAKLGGERDWPVVGDWDGDGKDDIGIYGPAWPGDPKAIERDPGLPDPDNTLQLGGRQKNVPPRLEDATFGDRAMQLGARGKVRSDIIDHVFHFGTPGDVPLVGDWNGDGIDSIAIFRDGKWNLDVDGDGRNTVVDRTAMYGQQGDVPVVGDWDGDGIDEIGVYRAGRWYLDTNHNLELDAADAVYELGGASDQPIVGDWNGDGKDDIGVQSATAPRTDADI